MSLRTRLMWPHKDDEVEIYRDGQMIADGHVIYSTEHEITVFGKNAKPVSLSGQELQFGIQNGSIVVKKKLH